MEKQVLKFDRRRRRVKSCPCGKSNKDGKFAPYVGSDAKGYCHSCGETYLPELRKYDNYQRFPFPHAKQMETWKHETGPVAELPFELIGQTLKHYERNNFIKYLVTLFGNDMALQLADNYSIGTAKEVKLYFTKLIITPI